MFGHKERREYNDPSVDDDIQSLLQTDIQTRKNIVNNLQIMSELLRRESMKPVGEQVQDLESVINKITMSNNANNNVPATTSTVTTRKRSFVDRENGKDPKSTANASTKILSTRK